MKTLLPPASLPQIPTKKKKKAGEVFIFQPVKNISFHLLKTCLVRVMRGEYIGSCNSITRKRTGWGWVGGGADMTRRRRRRGSADREWSAMGGWRSYAMCNYSIIYKKKELLEAPEEEEEVFSLNLSTLTHSWGQILQQGPESSTQTKTSPPNPPPSI